MWLPNVTRITRIEKEHYNHMEKHHLQHHLISPHTILAPSSPPRLAPPRPNSPQFRRPGRPTRPVQGRPTADVGRRTSDGGDRAGTVPGSEKDPPRRWLDRTRPSKGQRVQGPSGSVKVWGRQHLREARKVLEPRRGTNKRTRIQRNTHNSRLNSAMNMEFDSKCYLFGSVQSLAN